MALFFCAGKPAQGEEVELAKGNSLLKMKDNREALRLKIPFLCHVSSQLNNEVKPFVALLSDSSLLSLYSRGRQN